MALTPATETEETGKWKERRKVFVDDSVSPNRVIDAVVVVDEDGNRQVSLSGYKISNIDADASPNYYSFVRADGAYYILKETLSAGDDTYLYSKGSSDLATAWANRVTETYNTFDTEF